jgi:hypothetical protein
MRVDANYRFIAAYQEVNARVAQRQQALNLYVSLVVSLLAALVALRPASGAGTSLPAEWLVLGFPVATLSLALLNYKAERAITNLRRSHDHAAGRRRLGHRLGAAYSIDPERVLGALGRHAAANRRQGWWQHGRHPASALASP